MSGSSWLVDMMNKLALVQRKVLSFWMLELHSRRLLWQGLVLFPLIATSLKWLGVKRTQATLLWFVPEQESRTEDSAVLIAKTARMVRIAAAYYQPWANCLKKSLVLWSLLRQQGISSEIRIGVRQNDQTFEAHAWVEYEGMVLNDVRDVRDRFSAFDRPLEASITPTIAPTQM